ncbi:3-beta-hydroxysteroid-Delta(8),Delta(7)-isomerase [Truncatella angustata]|uniref:3-beta-hydroxysteroid-Delta(8), Delta(7)-isomerase n=1 Tax=Truncatella angustata TaxID=152316 RepID=A0A9P8UUP2_9PEZI|nr:3-beta-hydroxysteroid-Delta(8),Delta(7)-isomerase [Truncatella angustata]KAH6658516.1 3-beta-hydroxysteroid-Delta(8),Delta(7)-isomerase [Truncatella angustata]
MNSTLEAVSDAPLHPYYPLGVVITGFVAKTLSTVEILSIFTATCLSILVPTWAYIRRYRPHLSLGDRSIALWFVLCGSIHLGLEGYFALRAHDLASRSTVLAQLWKEYSMSDARYLTADSFVVCMETITAAFWGPLSFVCAWCIVNDHPLRHPLQSIISLGQLYGDVLYYATCTFDSLVSGIAHSRPEPAYFYGYYVFLNAFWIVIPLILLVQSTRETARAFASVQRTSKR